MHTSSSISIWASLPKLKLGHFSSTNKTLSTKVGDKVVELKQTRSLMGRMAMICQSNRNFDLKDAISNYELQIVPQSLMSNTGELLPGHEGKSLLIKELEIITPNFDYCETEYADKVVIIDAMVILHEIATKPSWVKTMDDLSKIFIQRIDNLVGEAKEVRLVFDTYNKIKSLKNNTRESRRKAIKEIPSFFISDSTNIEQISMSELLSSNDTKHRVTKYLGEKSLLHFSGMENTRYAVSFHNITKGNISCDIVNNHEEADTLIVWHAINASQLSKKEIFVKANDTDVLCILVSFSERLNKTSIQLKNRIIDVHPIFNALGKLKSRALLAFHALTGCDTTGKFLGIGKGTWFKTFLKADDNMVEAIRIIAHEKPLKYIDHLERFMVLQ